MAYFFAKLPAKNSSQKWQHSAFGSLLTLNIVAAAAAATAGRVWPGHLTVACRSHVTDFLYAHTHLEGMGRGNRYADRAWAHMHIE